MIEFLLQLFSADFMPHGHCYFWKPSILWLHAGSDALIALSYYCIPLVLFSIMKERRDLVFNWMFGLFATFIFLCGTTHIMDIWTIWHGTYRLEGVIKLVTALVSAATAVALLRIRPNILALPSAKLLREEIRRREVAQDELVRSQQLLEQRVEERTSELHNANLSLKRLATAVNASADAILALSYNGTVTALNRSAERLIGIDSNSAIGYQIWSLPTPFDPNTWRELTDRALHGETIIDREVQIRDTAPGINHRYYSVSVSPIRTIEGAIESISIIVRDISERRRHLDLFRMSVRSAPQAMLVINGKGEIVLSNEQSEALFGYSSNELAEMSIEQLVPKKIREGHINFRSSFMRNPAARPMGKGRELFGLRKDGSEVALEIGLTPIETSQGLLVISSLTDISEQRNAKAVLTASLHEKETLLKEIHHRIKNNLQVVSSLLRIQASQVKDEQTKRMFLESDERIRSIALVHQKLYRSDKLTKVDFKTYIEELAHELMRVHGSDARSISLHCEITPVELSIEYAVPCGLIINELIVNALKHAFDHGQNGNISIKLTDVDNRVTLTISDNGNGLAKGVSIEHPTTTGLIVIRTLCTQIGATLTMKGGDGATFIISFHKGASSE